MLVCCLHDAWEPTCGHWCRDKYTKTHQAAVLIASFCNRLRTVSGYRKSAEPDDVDEPYTELYFCACALASYPIGLGQEQLRGRRRMRKTAHDYLESALAKAELNNCLGRLSVHQLAVFDAWVRCASYCAVVLQSAWDSQAKNIGWAHSYVCPCCPVQ